jgi:hypothetical protein
MRRDGEIGVLGYHCCPVELLFFSRTAYRVCSLMSLGSKGLCVALHDGVMPEAGKQLARQA